MPTQGTQTCSQRLPKASRQRCWVRSHARLSKPASAPPSNGQSPPLAAVTPTAPQSQTESPVELLNPERALSTEMHDAPEKSLAEPLQPNPRPGEALSRIWLAAQAVWGHKWTSANGDLPIDDSGRLTVAGSLWAEGLRGITERQVHDALHRMAKLAREWPPTLPELRKAALGIPDFEAVSCEIISTQHIKRSAFARLVWSFVDAHAHRHAHAKDAERMRREAYERACNYLMSGGRLPPEPEAELTQDARPQGIPSERDQRIERLKRNLGDQFNPKAVGLSADLELTPDPIGEIYETEPHPPL